MTSTMSFLENEELIHLESILPLYTLVVFRQLAAAEDEKFTVKVPGRVVPAVNPDKSDTSWWGRASEVADPGHEMSETPVAAAEDDVDLEYIRLEMEKSYSVVETSKAAIAIRLKLSSSASLHLNNNKAPVVESSMFLCFSGVTRVEATSAYFAVEDFIVIDKFSPSPAIEHIVAIKPGLVRDESIPIFSAEYDQANDRKSTLKISALPLQLVLNELCVQQLLSFFNSSQAARSTILRGQFDPMKYGDSGLACDETPLGSKIDPRLVERAEATRVDLASLLASSSHGLEIVFEAETPKIIIPENSNSILTGYGLFDAGHLIVRGYVSFEGMAWDVSLGAVNAGMPLSAADIYSFHPSMYECRRICHNLTRTFTTEPEPDITEPKPDTRLNPNLYKSELLK